MWKDDDAQDTALLDQGGLAVAISRGWCLPEPRLELVVDHDTAPGVPQLEFAPGTQALRVGLPDAPGAKGHPGRFGGVDTSGGLALVVWRGQVELDVPASFRCADGAFVQGLLGEPPLCLGLLVCRLGDEAGSVALWKKTIIEIG